MNIAEMHVWFRQYAQQMGMQNVRAILPEQIDVLINTSISDITNQLVRENVGIRNDRVVTDNSKIGEINALRSLYKVDSVDKADSGNNKLVLDNNYKAIGLYSVSKFITEQNDDTFAISNVLYVIDLSIEYVKDAEAETPEYTRMFPVRIIEQSYLADTLNDFILKPRVRTPAAVIYNKDNAIKLDVYLGEDFANANGLINRGKIEPHKLRVSYIAKPAVVKYISDLGSDNVDCDLPESMHIDILKHAVDLYNVSINSGLYSTQQNQQAQQREMNRSEYRPANEGYQN